MVDISISVPSALEPTHARTDPQVTTQAYASQPHAPALSDDLVGFAHVQTIDEQFHTMRRAAC